MAFLSLSFIDSFNPIWFWKRNHSKIYSITSFSLPQDINSMLPLLEYITCSSLVSFDDTN